MKVTATLLALLCYSLATVSLALAEEDLTPVSTMEVEPMEVTDSPTTLSIVMDTMEVTEASPRRPTRPFRDSPLADALASLTSQPSNATDAPMPTSSATLPPAATTTTQPSWLPATPSVISTNSSSPPPMPWATSHHAHSSASGSGETEEPDAGFPRKKPFRKHNATSHRSNSSSGSESGSGFDDDSVLFPNEDPLPGSAGNRMTAAAASSVLVSSLALAWSLAL